MYENLFRNLLNLASLVYTVAMNCRGTCGVRVRCDVRIACCDVILSRVNLKAILRNVLSAFSVSAPLRPHAYSRLHGLTVESNGRRAAGHISLRTYGRSPVMYTGCNRRDGPDFGRVFLMLNYTDITQNTYIQS